MELALLDLGQLQEMLLLLLPLLNSSSMRNLLSPFSKDKASSSAEDDTACPICLASPTIPFLALPCQHRYILTDIPPCRFSLKLLLNDILTGCVPHSPTTPHPKINHAKKINNALTQNLKLTSPYLFEHFGPNDGPKASQLDHQHICLWV